MSKQSLLIGSMIVLICLLGQIPNCASVTASEASNPADIYRKYALYIEGTIRNTTTMTSKAIFVNQLKPAMPVGAVFYLTHAYAYDGTTDTAYIQIWLRHTADSPHTAYNELIATGINAPANSIVEFVASFGQEKEMYKISGSGDYIQADFQGGGETDIITVGMYGFYNITAPAILEGTPNESSEMSIFQWWDILARWLLREGLGVIAFVVIAILLVAAILFSIKRWVL